MASPKRTDSPQSVAVIGGGIGGATTALLLSSQGFTTTLLEAKNSLVEGPPFCHLHAGGCFYREISDDERFLLLEQSIMIARVFPKTIMDRPTAIIVPECDEGNPKDLIDTFTMVQQHYADLVSEDAANAVLGPPDKYYQAFSKEDLIRLKERPFPTNPSTYEEWVIPLAHHLDLDKMKYPILMTAEPGWSTLRQGAALNLACLAEPSCTLKFSSRVTSIVKKEHEGYCVTYATEEGEHDLFVDYIVNAAGHRTGEVDDWLGMATRNSAVEFKAAYIAKWKQSEDECWPEVLFHGPRNTEYGMAQLTPYGNGIFQLHGMTSDITLFPDGLQSVDSQASESSLPVLPSCYTKKIDHGWEKDDLEERTRRAVAHVSRHLPSFQSAELSGEQPLFGAQQIPGDNPDKRATSASFDIDCYARIEIVKGVSAIDAALQVLNNMRGVDSAQRSNRYAQQTGQAIETFFPSVAKVDETEFQNLALGFARERGYPREIGM